MRATKLAVLVAALGWAASAVSASVALSAEIDPDALHPKSGSEVLSGSSQTVVVQHGANFPLTDGSNHVGKPAIVGCSSSAGCTILISETVKIGFNQTEDYFFRIQTKVDGEEAEPGYASEPGHRIAQATTAASINVTYGAHKIDTTLIVGPSNFTGVLKYYLVTYTVYNR